MKLYSDSRVLLDAVSGGEKPSSNADQVNDLEKLAAQHKISWQWVRGHSGNIFNERCDELCIKARS